MLDKILNFLKCYITNVDEAVNKIGKYKTVSGALITIIEKRVFTQEELRKELFQ